MGTSKSNSGPKDKIPLLPDWALPPPEDGVPPPLDEDEEEQDSPPDAVDQTQNDDDDETDTDDAVDSSPDSTGLDAGQERPLDSQNGSWRSARTLLGKAVTGGGGSTGFRKAAQSYVRAHGGSRKAAQTATSGRAATARLGGFLADVARRGLKAALESLNLASVIGKDPRTVFAAISNAISPDGASPEQAVAREATNDVLAEIYEKFVGDDGDTTRVNSLTSEDVTNAVIESVCLYIYRSWLQELGKQIEKKGISSAQAYNLEREARLFVKDSVRLDFKTRDPLTMDWKTEGHSVIMNIFTEAYTLFGA